MTDSAEETEKRLYDLLRNDAKVSEIESRMDEKFNKIFEKLDLNAGGNSTFRGNYSSGLGSGRPFKSNKGR